MGTAEIRQALSKILRASIPALTMVLFAFSSTNSLDTTHFLILSSMLFKLRTFIKNIRHKVALSLSLRLHGKNVDFEKLAFELYNASVDKKWGFPKDYYLFHLDQKWLKDMLRAFDLSNNINLGVDYHPMYLSSNTKKEAARMLNRNNQYKDGKDLVSVIELFLNHHKDQLSEAIGSPHRIINIRAWEMLPATEIFGPSDWHTDGFHSGHMKIMLYLTELSASGGSIQLWNNSPLESKPGLVLVFKNSDLMHRAIPGRIGSRKLIELTVQRTEVDYALKPVTGSTDDRHLVAPWLVNKV